VAQFSQATWIILAVVSAAGVLSILNYLARRVKHQLAVHDLQIRVHQLRDEYARRQAALAELSEQPKLFGPNGGEAGFDIIEPSHSKAA